MGRVTTRHGTDTAYCAGCRCDGCRAAHTAACREYRARKRADGYAGLTHGSTGTYGLGCRCEPCRAAESYRGRGRYSRSRMTVRPLAVPAGKP